MWWLGEVADFFSKLVASVGGVVIAWKGVAEWKRATLQRADELRQRELEFRQKQAVFSRDVIKDVFADQRARNALAMLDFWEHTHQDADGKQYHVHRNQLQPVLRGASSGDDGVDWFIRQSFESLYDHLEQVENLLEVGVLNVADIDSTFRYYMQKASQDDIVHLEFLDSFDYPKAKRFMRRLATNAARSRR